MSEVNVAVTCMAGLVLAMSMFTRGIRQSLLEEPTLALLFGVAIGPVGLGWLALAGDHREVFEQTARFTLALVLVSVGMDLPRRYLTEKWRSLAVLTVGGMLLTWLATTLLLVWILGLELLPALLIGAVLTPIDPVLASGVTVGEIPERDLPERIRHLLGFEAAASHGLGYVLVLLPALLIMHPPAEAWSRWAVESLWRDVVVAVVVGAAIGLLVGSLHRWSLKRRLSATGSLTATFVALALSVMAAVHLLGSSGLLAVLVAGIAYARTRTLEKSDELEGERLRYETTFKQMLQVPVFVLLGVALPWSDWVALGWTGVVLVLAVLLLRRLPVVLALRPLVPDLRRFDVTLFVGWFGPAGAGAIHFALLAEGRVHLQEVWIVASLIIAASIVAHDVTVRPLTRWLDRRLEERPDPG